MSVKFLHFPGFIWPVDYVRSYWVPWWLRVHVDNGLSVYILHFQLNLFHLVVLWMQVWDHTDRMWAGATWFDQHWITTSPGLCCSSSSWPQGQPCLSVSIFESFREIKPRLCHITQPELRSCYPCFCARTRLYSPFNKLTASFLSHQYPVNNSQQPHNSLS